MKQQSNLVVRERTCLMAALSFLLLAGCEMFATEPGGSSSSGSQPQNTSRNTSVDTSSSSSGSSSSSSSSGSSSSSSSSGGGSTSSKTQSTTSSASGTSKTTSSSTGTGTGTGSKTNTNTNTVTNTTPISTELPLSTYTQCQPLTFVTKAATGATSVSPVSGGSTGEASRYWDCCKPTCSWQQNVSTSSPAPSCTQTDQIMSDANAQSSCDGGSAYACSSFVPWDVSPTLSYGWAAIQTGDPKSKCGHCYQLDFTGESTNPGTWATGCEALKGKSMIVQIMNTGADVKANQFDLLIPGGGVGLYNGCSKEWGVSNSTLGAQYGGFLGDLSYPDAMSGCGRCTYETNVEKRGGIQACILRRCQKTFGSRPDLIAGCEWFVRWFNSAANPKVTYKEVPCPAALTDRSKMK